MQSIECVCVYRHTFARSEKSDKCGLVSFPFRTEKRSVPLATDPDMYFLGTETTTKCADRFSPEDFILIYFKIFARRNENSVSRY